MAHFLHPMMEYYCMTKTGSSQLCEAAIDYFKICKWKLCCLSAIVFLNMLRKWWTRESGDVGANNIHVVSADGACSYPPHSFCSLALFPLLRQNSNSGFEVKGRHKSYVFLQSTLAHAEAAWKLKYRLTKDIWGDGAELRYLFWPHSNSTC